VAQLWWVALGGRQGARADRHNLDWRHTVAEANAARGRPRLAVGLAAADSWGLATSSRLGAPGHSQCRPATLVHAHASQGARLLPALDTRPA